MIALATAAALNSAIYEGPDAPLPEGWRQREFLRCPRTHTVLALYGRNHEHYMAVRGTWDRRDVMPSLRLFLGVDPTDRIAVAREFVAQRFGEAPENLAVGGHSIGGLVAAATAERFLLPGLAQNAPGWMTRAPDPARLSRFLQVRTARDVVGAWGSDYPRQLVLVDPSAPDWSLQGLHHLERQNQIIDEYGIGQRLVDDPALAPARDHLDANPDALGQRFSRAMERLRRARDKTRLHQVLARASRGPQEAASPARPRRLG